MANHERDERRDQEDFTAEILREATASGTPDEPSPPPEPRGGAFPASGTDDPEDDRADGERRTD